MNFHYLKKYSSTYQNIYFHIYLKKAISAFMCAFGEAPFDMKPLEV